MAAPIAAGLFRQAIVESGGETIHDAAAASHVAALAGQVLRERSLPPEALLTVEPTHILSLQADLKTGFERPFPFRAIVDGDFLPRPPITALKRGASANVGLLIGTNRDESILFLDRKQVGKPLRQSELADQDVAHAAPIFARYQERYAGLSPTARRVRFLTAEEYWRPSIAVARAHAAQKAASTYVYRFDCLLKAGPFRGWAGHASELGYVWNQLGSGMARSFGQSADGVDKVLADDMHMRWANFIVSGRPEKPGGIRWPAFDAAGSQLLFSEAPTRVGAVDREELALWPAL
jgi:para-nitrobenzyl esterase